MEGSTTRAKALEETLSKLESLGQTVGRHSVGVSRLTGKEVGRVVLVEVFVG